MKLKLVLATGTALGLLMSSAALAGSNNTLYLEQLGAGGNVADVDQAAGPGGNDIGTSGDPVTQNGSMNYFRFSNGAANNNYQNRYNNDVVKAEQSGDENWLNIGVSNLAHDNAVNDVQQLGNTNRLLIEQNGSNSGTIGTILQYGSTNSAVLKQNGHGNTIGNVEMVGDNNGLIGTGEITSGRNVSLRIVQTSGNGNLVMHARIEGDNNTQFPTNGYAPLLDIRQQGSNNGILGSIATILGSNGNGIKVTEIGNSNNFDIRQGVSASSSGNFVIATQTGDGNFATATQYGDGNLLNVSQIGSNNTSTTNFTGDYNGADAFSPSGVAGVLDASSTDLHQGTVLQNASGNTVIYTVLGSHNSFAFAQLGGSNAITGNVGALATPSAHNQIAVLQSGSGNVANFTQAGIGSNSAAITQ